VDNPGARIPTPTAPKPATADAVRSEPAPEPAAKPADAVASVSIPWPPADQKAINAAVKIMAAHPRETAKLVNALMQTLQGTDAVVFAPAQKKDIDAAIKNYAGAIHMPQPFGPSAAAANLPDGRAGVDPLTIIKWGG
jgi:4-hydroxy-L-threonine phosphate dehydrogenase PdxA